MAISRAVRRIAMESIEPETMAVSIASKDSPLDGILELERESKVRAGFSRQGEMDRETLVAFCVDGIYMIEFVSNPNPKRA